MSKKTALDRACEELVKNDCCFELCEHADNKCRCFAIKNTGRNDVSNICIEQFKKHFQEKVDIPDGGDVVKKRINYLDKRIQKYNPTKTSKKILEEGLIERDILERLCNQEGFEVDDEL